MQQVSQGPTNISNHYTKLAPPGAWNLLNYLRGLYCLPEDSGNTFPDMLLPMYKAKLSYPADDRNLYHHETSILHTLSHLCASECQRAIHSHLKC